MYNESDNLAVGYALGRDANDNNNGFGNGDWIWIIILFALFGWGGNGFGGFGGNNGGSNLAYDLGKVATTTDVASGFNNSAVLGSLNDLKLGQAGLQQTLCQGFNGVNTAILTGNNALQSQLATCCCGIERAIDGVNYNMATNTCAIQNTIQSTTRDILDGQRASTDAILGFLTNEKISSLQAENATLTAQLSQNAQTRTLIDTLRPVAQPAYITCSPYESVYGFNRSNCGCGF